MSRFGAHSRPATAISSWQSAPFTPVSLRPIFWLDAADNQTITASSGAVSQWNDKSGNGYNVTQATASMQPTTGSTTLNGLNTISFDGGDELSTAYSITQIRSSRAVSVFTVVKTNDLTGNHRIVTCESTAGNDYYEGFIHYRNTNQLVTYAGRGGGTGVVSDYEGRSFTNSSTAWMIFGSELSSSNGIHSAFLNGSSRTLENFESGTMAPSNFMTTGSANHRFNIGHGAGVRLIGGIAEVLIFDKRLSFSELDSLHKYLNTKWAVY